MSRNEDYYETVWNMLKLITETLENTVQVSLKISHSSISTHSLEILIFSKGYKD